MHHRHTELTIINNFLLTWAPPLAIVHLYTIENLVQIYSFNIYGDIVLGVCKIGSNLL